MKTILVNLLAIARKFKFATIINIMGLSAAFAAFIIILMQVNYEYSFEDCHPDAKQIYIGTRIFPDGLTYNFSRPYVDEVIKSSPYIEATTIIAYNLGEMYFTVNLDENIVGYTEKIYSCYPGITRVFNFEMVEGDKDCLQKPGTILIPESLAKKVFGDQTAIGKELMTSASIWTVPDLSFFIVGGVYKDFPANTQVNNGLYVHIEQGRMEWGSGGYILYVKLNGQIKAEDIAENFNHNFERIETDGTLEFMPIKDIYFTTKFYDNVGVKTGNKTITGLLLFIAFLVIGIAVVNYVNFSTSLAPMRMKSINTQKVLGCSNFVLRRVLLAESICICLISFFISLVIIYILNQIQFLTFIDADMQLSNHTFMLLSTFLLAVAIGIFAGLYPSYYMTSFSPALVLKGSHGLSPAGRRLRISLICFQFIISYGLIIIALFIQQQNRFMQYYDLGFDTEQIAVVPIDPKTYTTSKDIFINKMKENPGIEDVAFSTYKFGASNNYNDWVLSYKDREFRINRLHVSWNFLNVIGVSLLDGHEITPVYEQSAGLVFYAIPNKRLYEEYEMEIDTQIEFPWGDKYTIPIIGYTDNLNYTSLRYNIQNTCFLIAANNEYNYSYIRIGAGANINNIVSHIHSAFKEVDPAYPVEIEFLDSAYNNLYKKEQEVSKMIFLFSLLAAIISIVGVFGLVIFESQYRIKEIAIRKVHGATINSILWIFNSHYTKIITGCFIVAVPLAWYGVNEWLKGFAYKIPMYWWIYVIAFLVIACITLSTVTFQSWVAATKNPTDSIKIE